MFPRLTLGDLQPDHVGVMVMSSIQKIVDLYGFIWSLANFLVNLVLQTCGVQTHISHDIN